MGLGFRLAFLETFRLTLALPAPAPPTSASSTAPRAHQSAQASPHRNQIHSPYPPTLPHAVSAPSKPLPRSPPRRKSLCVLCAPISVSSALSFFLCSTSPPHIQHLPATPHLNTF